jgi:hypothetical protein
MCATWFRYLLKIAMPSLSIDMEASLTVYFKFTKICPVAIANAFVECRSICVRRVNGYSCPTVHLYVS